MTLSRDTIKAAVKSSIVELVSEFQKQPYVYLFESDLQASLYARLRSLLSESVNVYGTGKPEQRYLTNVVHTEYWKRIDIVCLDPNSEQWSNKREHKESDISIYELPILVGIELKYRKMGDVFELSSCVKDFKKLSDAGIHFPIALGFLQHSSYEGSFFAGISSQYDCTEVEDIEPFQSIHVISPRKVWKVKV